LYIEHKNYSSEAFTSILRRITNTKEKDRTTQKIKRPTFHIQILKEQRLNVVAQLYAGA